VKNLSQILRNCI